DLPDLLHRELPHLRLFTAEGEPVESDAGEVALCPLGEHRDLGDEVGAGLEVAELAALATAALVARAHAHDAAVRDEELLGRGLGEDHRSALFRALGEKTAELGEREHPVAVVPHQQPRRWRTSSVSLGTVSCTSPTTPRSLNSKIGAFASLLIATIVPELCMPTLCWIAPEMPRAT